jgi:aminoglycoside phosphotransferase (APT) family kinase protein
MPDVKLQPLLEAIRPAAVKAELDLLLGESSAPPEFVSSRLQAPTCYWAVYRRQGRLATLKSFFDGEAYGRYIDKLIKHYGGRLDAPRHPQGGIRLAPRWNAILWSAPFDPRMPGLHLCFDTEWVAASIDGASGQQITASLLNYAPEIGALFAYRAGRRALAYGKISADKDGQPAFDAMQTLWSSTSERRGVRFARPLAYVPEVSFLLQAPVSGRIIPDARNSEAFLDLAAAAGPALAAIHRSGIGSGPRRTLEGEIDRVRRGLDELILTAPALYQSLRQLLRQIEARAGQSTAADPAPSHGDYKWNQFLAARGRFSLIDFELFCQAEPYLDLGYFCAYLPPASPEDWRDGLATELLRTAFLQSYAGSAAVALDFRRLGIYEALMLALRALSHVWQHQGSWHLQASQLLDLAFERLVAPEPASLDLTFAA